MADTGKIQNEVRHALQQHFGYDVEPIPEHPSERRADFLALRDGERLVVEVTSKTDSGDFEREVSGAGQAVHETRIAKGGAISRVFASKNEQLKATPQAADAVRILWVTAVGCFRDTIARQVEATFYGRVSVPVSSDEGIQECYCYFFDHAACFSMPSVDAVVVSIDGGGRLLLNPMNEERAKLVEQTRLGCLFANNQGLISPFAEEAAGLAFSAHDFSGDRSDEKAIRSFMENKYDVRPFLPLRWNLVTAAVYVSHT